MQGFLNLREIDLLPIGFPLLEGRICMLLDVMCPCMKVLAQTCLRAFLNCLIEFKTLCCGIFPARSLTLLLGFFPLTVIYPSLMAFPPLRGSRLYAPRRDVLPRGSVNADMPTGLSRSPTRVEPSIVRILPLRVT